MAKHIIIGPPGTGKTSTLIKIIEDLFNKGISPKEICFCSFSKSAAEEAIERTILKFGLEKKDLHYFGTIHSICFRNILLDKKVISSKNKQKFFNNLGVEYELIETDEDLLTMENNLISPGNVLLEFYDKIRINYLKEISEINEQELKGLFNKLEIGEDKFESIFSDTINPYKILKDYSTFKEENSLVDFIDMLLVTFKLGYNVPCKVLIVDEFQDLSPLQYSIYKQWSSGKEEIFLAGDDDQTIYKFICANYKFFLNEIKSIDKKNGDEKIVLSKTYRMLSNINNYCKSYIRNNIKGDREDKDQEPFRNGGEVSECYVDNLNDVLNLIRKDKFTFILFRTNYYKRKFIEEVLIQKGIIYYEIRGTSIWNSRTINLFNAVVKLVNKKEINYNELKSLIENIPFKYGLIKRGVKSSFKNLEKREYYTITELLQIGFSINLFNVLDYDNFFDMLDISESINKSFKESLKKEIELPIKLKLGTIHSSKGKEADDVLIFKDVPKKVFNEMSKSDSNFDDEIRLFYVGCSRAKERLVILRGGFKFSESTIIP